MLAQRKCRKHKNVRCRNQPVSQPHYKYKIYNSPNTYVAAGAGAEAGGGAAAPSHRHKCIGALNGWEWMLGKSVLFSLVRQHISSLADSDQFSTSASAFVRWGQPWRAYNSRYLLFYVSKLWRSRNTECWTDAVPRSLRDFNACSCQFEISPKKKKKHYQNRMKTKKETRKIHFGRRKHYKETCGHHLSGTNWARSAVYSTRIHFKAKQFFFSLSLPLSLSLSSACINKSKRI